MAISQKPKPPSAQQSLDEETEALVNKGLSVKKDDAKSETTVLLRIPNPFAERLDRIIKAKPIRTPRHTWILEAILEKLEREGQGS